MIESKESTAVESIGTSMIVVTESIVAAASSFLAPHATIAIAKPNTIRDATIFFIVIGFFEFDCKGIRIVGNKIVE